MRGRRPKSTAYKIATGTRKSRINANEPQPTKARPNMPAWLDATAQARWEELVPELERMGVLTVVDGDALAAYCTALSELESATRDIQALGRTYYTVSGVLKPRPAVAMQRSAWKAIKDFAAMLGLDPVSRGRLNVAPPDDDPVEDPLKIFAS